MEQVEVPRCVKMCESGLRMRFPSGFFSMLKNRKHCSACASVHVRPEVQPASSTSRVRLDKELLGLATCKQQPFVQRETKGRWNNPGEASRLLLNQFFPHFFPRNLGSMIQATGRLTLNMFTGPPILAFDQKPVRKGDEFNELLPGAAPSPAFPVPRHEHSRHGRQQAASNAAQR